VTAQAQLGRVRGKSAHPVGVGGDLDGGDGGPQVTGHRGLAREDADRAALDGVVEQSEPFDLGEDLPGAFGVDLEQCGGGASGGDSGQFAHVAEVCAEELQLAVKLPAHAVSFERSGSGTLLYPPGTAANPRRRPCHIRADVMAIRDGTKFTVEYGIQTPTSKTMLGVTEGLEVAQRTLDMVGDGRLIQRTVSYSPWVEVDARAQTSG
jgi:hypothetical protein